MRCWVSRVCSRTQTACLPRSCLPRALHQSSYLPRKIVTETELDTPFVPPQNNPFSKLGQVSQELYIKNPSTLRGYYSFLSTAIADNHPDKALAIAERMRYYGVPLSRPAMSNILAACERKGDFDAALAWTKMFIKENEIDGPLFGMLLKVVASSKNVRHAMECFLHEFLPLYADEIYKNEIAVGYALMIMRRQSMTLAALQLFAEFRVNRKKIGPITWQQVIGICVNAGRPQDAEMFFDEAVRSGVVHTERTYQSLVRCFAVVQRDLDKAARYYFSYRSSGEPFSHKLYFLIMKSCASHANMQIAMRAFQDARDSLAEVGIDHINSLLAVMNRSKNYEDALVLFRVIRESGTQADVTTYTEALRACESVGAPMKELFDEMKTRRCVDRVSFGVYILALSRQGKFDEAVAEVVDMERFGVRPNSHIFCALLRACKMNKSGVQIEKVLQMLDEHRFRIDDFVLHRLMDAYIACDDHAGAVVALKGLQERGYPLTFDVTFPLLQELASIENLNESDREFVDQAMKRCEPRHADLKTNVEDSSQSEL